MTPAALQLGQQPQGGEAIGAPTDVTNEPATANMAKAAVDRFGRIDGLVNNAALMSVLPRRAWHEIDVDEWDRVMAVNLKGVFLCARAVYPQMKKQGRGKIVNISSNRVWDGTPNRLHYTTSKAGVVGLTRALAREVGDDNITVNAISPGFTLSETQMASTTNAYAASKSAALQVKSLKRDQVPDDLVGATLLGIGGVAVVAGAALAHHVEAQRSVRQLGGNVDGARHRRQRVRPPETPSCRPCRTRRRRRSFRWSPDARASTRLRPACRRLPARSATCS